MKDSYKYYRILLNYMLTYVVIDCTTNAIKLTYKLTLTITRASLYQLLLFLVITLKWY